MRPTLYLRLFHGRNDPDEDMKDWGFDGPIIGPVDIGWTYGNIRINGENLIIPLTHEDMIYFAGKFYGDFEINTPEEVQLMKTNNPDLVILNEYEFMAQYKIDYDTMEKLPKPPVFKPTLIISSEGGVNHNYMANCEMDVYNLDQDIFECDLDQREYFEDRRVTDVERHTIERFAKTLERERDEWNKKMDNHPSFIEN